MINVTFLHIRGLLYENMVYVPQQGCETNAPKRHQGSEGFEVVLLNKDNREILAEHPSVESYCLPANATQRYSLKACLPLHPEGTQFEIRKAAQVLYRSNIQVNAPILKLKTAKKSGEKIALKWQSEHTLPHTYSILARMDSGRSITLVKNLTAKDYVIDLTTIRASGKGQIVIAAHDGIRSTEVTAMAINLPAKPPHLQIITPEHNSSLPFGQPVSVVVSCHDIDGNILTIDTLSCLLDGEVLSNGNGIVALENLSAGKHKLEFSYTGEMGTISTGISFAITKPDEAYKWWEALVERVHVTN